MRKFIVALLLIIASVFAPLSQVYAEGESEEKLDLAGEEDSSKSSSWIQVTPVSAHVVLRPGQSLEYSVIVSNKGSEKFNYSVYAAPYSIVDEDYNISFSNETNRTQIARWITFLKEDGSTTDKYLGTLEPGERHTVNYRISVPDDIPEGGQYATIFAQTEKDDNEDITGIKTVSRIGMVVYGRTNGETVDSAKIVDYNIPGFLTHGPITATSKVANDGNTDLEVKYNFTVKSIVGNELYSTEDVQNILPDTERRATFEWENTSAMGIFWVTYKVTATEEIVREETRLVIILPVYMIVIMIILLTILVIWIIMLVRKRKERKARLKV